MLRSFWFRAITKRRGRDSDYGQDRQRTKRCADGVLCTWGGHAVFAYWQTTHHVCATIQANSTVASLILFGLYRQIFAPCPEAIEGLFLRHSL
jgi:hypothetical protein